MMRYVEKEPHGHSDRVRELHRTGIATALSGDITPAALRARISSGTGPKDVIDWSRWAGWARNGVYANTCIQQADSAMQEDPDWLGKSLGRSALYGRHYLGWLTPLLQAYALTGDERYATAWVDRFEGWLEERDGAVGGFAGLEVVWYSLGVGLRANHLLAAATLLAPCPAVDDASYERILAELVAGARWLDEEHDAFRHGNWQLAGCAALIRVGLVLPELTEAAQWVSTAHTRMEEHLALDFYADGGHYERSPAYHTMSLEMLVTGAIVAEHNTDWRLGEDPRFGAMFQWLLAMSSPGGWVPPFNDSPVLCPWDTLIKGAYLVSDSHLRGRIKWHIERHADRADVERVLASLPVRPGHGDPLGEYEALRSIPPLANSEYLAFSKFVLLRSGWEEDSMYAAMNVGPHVEHELDSHSHRASLDIVLAVGGRPVVWEAGGPVNYDVKNYQEWFQAARSHSTISVGEPGSLTDHGSVGDPVVLDFQHLYWLDHVTAVSERSGGIHRRRLLSMSGAEGPRYWLLSDHFDGPSATWSLHGVAPWIRNDEGWLSDGDGIPAYVALAGNPPAWTLRTGPTRLPAGEQGDGLREATLDTLVVPLTEGRLDCCIMPVVRGQSQASIRRESGTVVVRVGDWQDEITDRGIRRRNDGVIVAGAQWDIGDADFGLSLDFSPPLAAISWVNSPGRLTVHGEARGRTDVSFRKGTVAPAHVSLQGVDLDLRRDPTFTLPSAGTWVIECVDGARP
jgi:hypothetical protein